MSKRTIKNILMAALVFVLSVMAATTASTIGILALLVCLLLCCFID